MNLNKVTNTLGWTFSVMVSLIFALGAFIQISFVPTPDVTSPVNYPGWFHLFVGICFAIASFLHLIPRTAFALLGAILMTGFFGGIVGTHLLQNDGQWWIRLMMGLLPWAGLYLRDQTFNDMMSFWRSQDDPTVLPS